MQRVMAAHPTTTCNLTHLGLIGYHTAWELQRRLAAARAQDAIADTLLLLEHPHTYTLGRSGHAENLLMGAEERKRRGVMVVDVDRGGDITYHGPGQLVAYPILYLGRADPHGHLPTADYVGYLRRLEHVLIRTLASFGVTGRQEKGYTGVWVDTAAGPEKIAAIGVRVSAQGVSTHGVSLNVDPDLSYFEGIVPCGITDRAVTSLRKLLGAGAPSMELVNARFAAEFAEVFERRMVATALHDLLPAAD